MSTSTFFGLELSRRALNTQQLALDITGHNIANANTQGYTRQVANMTSTTPYSVLALGRNLSLGTGVNLDYISRARDSFVDRQFRWETAKQQYWEGRQDSLQKIEGLLNEPSDNSLHDDLDKFWVAWSDLSKGPENMGARAVVRQRALALVDTFHHIDQQVRDLRNSLDASVRTQINQINVYADQIKNLNDQIKRAEVAGDSPNDLRDKRDAIVDQLAKMINIRVIETKDPKFTDREVSSYTVVIGDDSQILVDDSNVYHIKEPDPLDPDNVEGTFAKVEWGDDSLNPGVEINLGNKLGSLQGYIDMRDDFLKDILTQYNDLAKAVATSVNEIHQLGQGLTNDDPIDFFTFDPSVGGDFTASNLFVNSQTEDLERIAARESSIEINKGDGSIAARISLLANGWAGITPPLESTSIGDYYGANIAKIGVMVQEANRMKEGQDVLVTHMNNQRESYSGVSLDEEMTNLIKFQKSYSAAARLVTMMDEMLDTIVNRMGLTR